MHQMCYTITMEENKTKMKEVKTMITKKMIFDQLNKIYADSDYFDLGNRIVLVINDFEGFDENWDEIEREYINPEAIEEVLQWFKTNAYYTDGNGLYFIHHFDDVVVQIDFASNDI